MAASAAAATTETIQLDAFHTSLHGTRILLQGPFPSSARFPPLLDWIQRLRDPFKRRVLLTGSPVTSVLTSPLLEGMMPTVDAVFHVKDKEIADWQLALTYLAHAPKPVLLLIDDVHVPDGFWSKVPTSTVTAVHLVSAATRVVHLRPYHALFFAPMEDISTSFSEYTHKMIQSVYRASYSYQEHKDILAELRVAQAGIAWTNVDEDRPMGALYWYDPDTHSTVDRLSNQQLKRVLEWLARTVS